MRARYVYAAMLRIAEDHPLAEDDSSDVASFLRNELPPHLDDEEQDFFPLLRRRCTPEEAIDATLDELLSDHVRERADMAHVATLMARLEQSEGVLTPAEADEVRAFARHNQRHMIVENAIIVPLARAHLTLRDKDRLLMSMLRRRGLDRLWTAVPTNQSEDRHEPD